MGLGTLVVDAEQVAAALDPAVLSPCDAQRLLAEAVTLRNIADGMCAVLSPRAAASGQWRRDGARTEAEWIGRQLGVSDRDAAAALDVGRAAAAGELGTENDALLQRQLVMGQGPGLA